MEPLNTGEDCHGIQIYTRKLSRMEKETIIELFLAQQEQLENIDKNLQLVLEQQRSGTRPRKRKKGSAKKIWTGFLSLK